MNNVENFTFENKFKIWMHYVVSIFFLNNDLLEVDVHKFTENHFGKDYRELIKYPVLLPNKMFVNTQSKIKQRSFLDFCNEVDERNSHGLIGYYWRFKTKIGII